MTMLNSNILITTIVVLICLSSIADARRDDDFEDCHCVTTQNETKCRYAPKNSRIPKKCASDPNCTPNEHHCLPLFGKHPPMELNFSLCEVAVVGPIIKPTLKKLKTSDLVITICYNHLICKGKPTRISVKVENCMVYIKIENVDTTLNCIIVLICKITNLDLLRGPKNSDSAGITQQPVTQPNTGRGPKPRPRPKSSSSECDSCSFEKR